MHLAFVCCGAGLICALPLAPPARGPLASAAGLFACSVAERALFPGTVLDIADTYTWGKTHLELAADDYHQRTLPWSHSAVGGAEPDWSFVLESDPKLLGLALSVPLLALLLLVSLRIELHKGIFSLKAQAAAAAWSARRSDELGALHRGARYLAATVLRAGPVPRHVAFIMASPTGNPHISPELHFPVISLTALLVATGR